MARAGYLLILDEFQYFNRAELRTFCSYLQAEVDALSAVADQVPGGLIVLGSIHTEMMAILNNSSAPLYSRTTDEIELSHLDIQSVVAILREHADTSPERLLFLWTLFEGVPKFYRDCYEQEVLDEDRPQLLRRIFFESSSPLRTEADNWFLKELRGRYDVILKLVARRGGCMHGELVGQVRELSGDEPKQVAGYLKILVEKYRLIERRLPIFAEPKARRTRYYLADNFLQAWLAVLASRVSALAFGDVNQLVMAADRGLHELEGRAFEKLVGTLYHERSRKGLGDFRLTHRIEGYWDSADTELDLVALNEEERVVRFGSCKRSADRLIRDMPTFTGHVERFLEQFPKYREWDRQLVCLAPAIPEDIRTHLSGHGFLVQDLADLTDDWT